MKLPATVTKLIINLWPPFRGAGIRVTHLSADWRQAEVQLKLGLTNRNYVGVHFGGSLYAMTDPFFMLLLMQQLGPDYYVWDKAGHIDYVKPGRGTVKARFHVDEDLVSHIRQQTASGDKYLPQLQVEVHDQHGDVVARVHKTLYVKRKKDR